MEKQNCIYDYANKCDCSEDDRCGCTYPNNMSADFDCEEILPTTKHRRFPDNIVSRNNKTSVNKN